MGARAAPFRRQTLGLRGWIERLFKEYAAIAAAITSHDVVRAGERMHRHMNHVGRKDYPRLVSLFADQMAAIRKARGGGGTPARMTRGRRWHGFRFADSVAEKGALHD